VDPPQGFSEMTPLPVSNNFETIPHKQTL